MAIKRIVDWKSEFRNKVYNAIKESGGEDSGYSSEFYQQIEQLIMDLYECIGEFSDKMSEKYEDEMCFSSYQYNVSAIGDNYGSGRYEYERQSKAKVACKKALQQAMDDLHQNFEDGKKDLVSQCINILSKIDSDIKEFIKEFQDSYDDYASLDCEQEAMVYAEKMKSNITSDKKIVQMYKALDIEGKINAIIKELYDDPIAELLNVQEYFEMCEYDGDDDFYSYDLGDAICELNDAVCGLYDEACKALEDEVTDLYQSALSEFTCDLQGSLIEMIPMPS